MLMVEMYRVQKCRLFEIAQVDMTSFYRVSLIRGKPIIFEKSSVVASTASTSVSVSVVSSKVTDNKDVTDESMYDGEDDIRELDWDSDSVLFDPNVCSYK